MAQIDAPMLTCWLLDTRSIWQGQKIDEAAEDELELVSQQERDDIKKKFRIQDARMSLGSALLKRLFVAKTLGVPWRDIKFSRKVDPKHGKPCYRSSNGTIEVEFNVSHQAGLVALVGCKIPALELGVDIVCVNERNDYRTIDAEGIEGFVNIFSDVFSDAEGEDMKYSADRFKLLDGIEVHPDQLDATATRCTRRGRNLGVTLSTGEKRTFDSELLIDAKLRRFYTFWCYKEAYIKLTGEALLAAWLKQCEFRNVRAPAPGTVARCSTNGTWGEIVNDAQVWLHGERLEDVALQIQSFEEQFMISVAAKPISAMPAEAFPSFEKINVKRDIMDFAY